MRWSAADAFQFAPGGRLKLGHRIDRVQRRCLYASLEGFVRNSRLRKSSMVLACAFWGLLSAASAQQGNVTVNMSFTGLVGCDLHPQIPIHIDNVPFKANGRAVLRQNRQASMDLSILGLLPTRIRLNATLGGGPTRVPGGTAELRVISESELQMAWHLRTSSLIARIRLSGTSCSMTVDSQLKPGESKYSVYDGRLTHSCAKPRYTDVTCSAR